MISAQNETVNFFPREMPGDTKIAMGAVPLWEMGRSNNFVHEQLFNKLRQSARKNHIASLLSSLLKRICPAFL